MSKNITVILGHSDGSSFCNGIPEEYATSAQAAGYQVVCVQCAFIQQLLTAKGLLALRKGYLQIDTRHANLLPP